MPANYIPAKLNAFKNFALNFSTLLSATPGVYGLVAGDAASVAAAYLDFSTKYATSSSNATRTPVAVAATQTSRNALSVLIRAFSRIILANSGVADSDKTALGLNIHDTLPTPIPAPGTAPVLGLVGATPGVVTLTFRDTGSSLKSRSKPAGVAGLELHALFGSVAPATPAATPFLEDHTRSPFAVNCPSGSAGQTVWLYGRWKNAKGWTGPWSALLSTAVI
jgi:hypothetical protein